MKRSSTPPLLPPRPDDGNKGTFGRVLVVGGSAAMAGAPVLSGRAALRTGSGLVQLAVSDLMHTASIGVCPELIGLSDAHKLATLLDAAQKADVVAVGPGWGQSPANRRTLLALLELDATLVVDADALNLLATGKSRGVPFNKSRGVLAPTGPGTARLSSDSQLKTKARLVLTPHPGEMKRLAEAFGLGDFSARESSRIAIAKKLARLVGGIALLKGARTVVTDGERVFINTTGDSSLAKAGTGDVLTGIIASLIGQGMTPFDAACLGAHLHGVAGELAGKRLGRRSVLASDVIEAIPAALNALTRASRKRRRPSPRPSPVVPGKGAR